MRFPPVIVELRNRFRARFVGETAERETFEVEW